MAKSVNGGDGGADDADSDATTPICRCRVLYLGSAVPHITKDGLQGIQEPLKDLYPEQGVFWNADRDHSATGIDSWLSVWSNGILVENVDDKGNTVRRFHPIESLHYCAAVRYVSVPSEQKNSDNKISKFLPLDSPFSKSTIVDAANGHPPLFACILRRTSGIKVLECHAFICKKEAAANALVRCCFHAYADTMHARQIEMESPYEQLDKRRSRSIGSALDAQSLRSIDEKVNAWQKNSTGGSSSGTGEEVNGFHENMTRSISRQKARTPSIASLASHQVAEPNGLPPMEPIYYNGIGNGTLRSVKSFISLATLKSQKKMRPRQIPMPMSPPPPPPVMFATLSKKELKKALKKESTLKRKHKYKDLPGPFLPNGYPVIYGPPPPPSMPPHGMPIYAPLPPSGPGPFFTLDRKGRMTHPPQQIMHGPPPPHILPSENGHHHHHPHHPPMLPPPQMGEEPIYMPALSTPNGTLRPVTPHGEPIYFEGRNGGPPMPPPMQPHMGPPMFIQHPQTGSLLPCTFVPTLSRKELKELEKQKALMKKAAKKEKKKIKNGKIVPQPEPEMYQTRPPPPFPYQVEMEHPDAMLMIDSHPSQASYNSNGSGGIYKKKGHLNERAFSYSIRQEHRSRSNSLSNLAFENSPPLNGTPRNGEEASNHGNSHHDMSNHASSVSLKSIDTGSKHPYNGDYGHINGHGGQHPHENGKVVYLNGNGRISSNGSLHALGPDRDGIDPNLLATRMSNLKLNGIAPPPPPPNGYNYQKTATIKRL